MPIALEEAEIELEECCNKYRDLAQGENLDSRKIRLEAAQARHVGAVVSRLMEAIEAYSRAAEKDRAAGAADRESQRKMRCAMGWLTAGILAATTVYAVAFVAWMLNQP
jgi:hypothetical protein